LWIKVLHRYDVNTPARTLNSRFPRGWIIVLVLAAACGRAGSRGAAYSRADEGDVREPAIPAIEQLRARGARVRPYQPERRPSDQRFGCALEEGLVLLRGPTGVTYSRPPRVRGTFALRLARFEELAQAQAQRVFGRPLERIEHAGTFVCRAIRNSGVASQHAFGNAIDVTAFVLRGGRRISVRRDFVRGAAVPEKPAGLFLARLLEQTAAEGLFRTMLTPDFDSAHAGHLHLDARPGFAWRSLFGS
jgi:hypothetical protein